MNKVMSKILSSLFSACAVLAMGAAPAPAASSGGATVYKQDSCQLFDTDYVCTKVQGEYNLVITPKGGFIYQGNDRYEFTTYRDGVFYYGGEGSNHYTFVVARGGEQQQNLNRYSQTLTNDVETCSYSYAYHLVNGQIQFDNFDFSCVPV